MRPLRADHQQPRGVSVLGEQREQDGGVVGLGVLHPADRRSDREVVDQTGLRVVPPADAVVGGGEEDAPVGKHEDPRVVPVAVDGTERLPGWQRRRTHLGPLHVDPVTVGTGPGVGAGIVDLRQPVAVPAAVDLRVVADPRVTTDGQDPAVGQGEEGRIPATPATGRLAGLGQHRRQGRPGAVVVVRRAVTRTAPVLQHRVGCHVVDSRVEDVTGLGVVEVVLVPAEQQHLPLGAGSVSRLLPGSSSAKERSTGRTARAPPRS